MTNRNKVALVATTLFLGSLSYLFISMAFSNDGFVSALSAYPAFVCGIATLIALVSTFVYVVFDIEE